jgi:hypothetical protein
MFRSWDGTAWRAADSFHRIRQSKKNPTSEAKWLKNPEPRTGIVLAHKNSLIFVLALLASRL